MSQTAHTRSLYRALLRELPPRPMSGSRSRTPLHQRIRQNFSQETASAKTSEQIAAQTDQLVRYLRAQRQYVALIERYNPGMGMDEEERIRLTARRVGMDLPIEYGGTQE